MEIQDYLSGRCLFLLTQNAVSGAITLCLTNGSDRVCTSLSLQQVMELAIPIENIVGFDNLAYRKFYQLPIV